MQHGLGAPARLPVAVPEPQALLRLEADLFQLHRLVAAVLELGFQDPAPRALGGGTEFADLRADDEGGFADELVQLSKCPRPATCLGSFVIIHRHSQNMVALFFQIKRHHPLQRAAHLQILLHRTTRRKLQPLHRTQARRLHLCVDAHIADLLPHIGGEVVVCAERAAECLADVGGAKGDGEVEDRRDEEWGRVRVGFSLVGEGCGSGAWNCRGF